jgi:hypothetical protein
MNSVDVKMAVVETETQTPMAVVETVVAGTVMEMTKILIRTMIMTGEA